MKISTVVLFSLMFYLLFNQAHSSEWNDPGLVYFKQGNFEHAAAHWERELRGMAIPSLTKKSFYRHLDTLLLLADAYWRLGRLDQALKHLNSGELLLKNRKWCQPPSDTCDIYDIKILLQFSDVHLSMQNLQQSEMGNCTSKELENKDQSPQYAIRTTLDNLDEAEKRLVDIDPDKNRHYSLWASLCSKKGNVSALEAVRWHTESISAAELENVQQQKLLSLFESKCLLSSNESIPSRFKDKIFVVKHYYDAMKKLYDSSIMFSKGDNTSEGQERASILSARISNNRLYTLLALSNSSFKESTWEGHLTERLKNTDVLNEIRALPTSFEKVFISLGFIEFMLINRKHFKVEQVREALKQIEEYTLNLGNKRLRSYFYFYQARLLEEEQKYVQALPLTREAIFLLQEYPFPFKGEVQKSIWGYSELLFKLEWQLARLLRRTQPKGEAKCSLAFENEELQKSPSLDQSRPAGCTYERANQYLDLAYASGYADSSFRKERELFYTDWAEFISKEIHHYQDQKEKSGVRGGASTLIGKLEEKKLEQLRKKYRKLLEMRGKLEVQNYLNDPCVTEVDNNNPTDINESIDRFLLENPETAVLHLTVFSERIDLLLSLKDGLFLFETTDLKTSGKSESPKQFSKEELQKTIDGFKNDREKWEEIIYYNKKEQLEPLKVYESRGEEFLQKAFEWFFSDKPLLSEKLKDINKLNIVVTDRLLSVIPFAALSGKKNEYLISLYAITVTPTIALSISVDKKQDDFPKGVSVSTDNRLESSFPALLAGSNFRGENKMLGSISRQPGEPRPLKCAITELNKIQDIINNMDADVNYLSNLLKSGDCSINISPSAFVIANEKFTLANLKQALEQKSLLADADKFIIHFVSHGEFGSEPRLLINNEKEFISLKDLGDLIRQKQGKLSMLGLSACQSSWTEGEFVLGLSGAALRVGAAKVLSPLWIVNDTVAAYLMIHFYQGYWKKNLPASEALKLAQESLLKEDLPKGVEKHYHHPFYWAPFLVLGSTN